MARPVVRSLIRFPWHAFRARVTTARPPVEPTLAPPRRGSTRTAPNIRETPRCRRAPRAPERRGAEGSGMTPRHPTAHWSVPNCSCGPKPKPDMPDRSAAPSVHRQAYCPDERSFQEPVAAGFTTFGITPAAMLSSTSFIHASRGRVVSISNSKRSTMSGCTSAAST